MAIETDTTNALGLETRSVDGAVAKSGAVGTWPGALPAPAAAQPPAAPRKAGSSTAAATSSSTAAASSSSDEGLHSPLPENSASLSCCIDQHRPPTDCIKDRVDFCKTVAESGYFSDSFAWAAAASQQQHNEVGSSSALESSRALMDRLSVSTPPVRRQTSFRAAPLQ